LPEVAKSPWLPDGLAAILAVLAVTWLGYTLKQWRDGPERWETWLDQYFLVQTAKQGDVLERVLTDALPFLFDVYFSLRPALELPVEPTVLRNAAVEIEVDPAAGPQRSRDLIVLPLINQFQVRLLESMPLLAHSMVVLPPMIEALMTLGCYDGDLERYRRRLNQVRIAYVVAGVTVGAWLIAIVLTRAYDWTPLALIAPALIALVLTLVAEGMKERVRGRLRVRKSLQEMIES
jgi:hypothetical protein